MLRREVVAPIHSYTVGSIAFVLGLTATVTMFSSPKVDAEAPAPAIASEEVPVVASAVVAAVEPAPPAPVTDVNLTFRAGKTLWMKLGPLDAKQKHGKLKLHGGHEKEWNTSVIGAIASADLPTAHRHWIGARVIVDGACTANITGFAAVSWLNGDAGYAGEQIDRWTTRTVFEHGEKMLAARLDGCENGTFARDAELPPIAVPVAIEDAVLAKQARAKLLASKPARSAQKRWAETDGWLEYHKPKWHQDQIAVFDIRVLRHPTTHVTFVSAHAKVEYGCGGVEISIWGLYRAGADGTLEVVQERDYEQHTLDRLIDLENDGELELIGRPWLHTDVVVQRESGAELERLALPHYFCPC